MSSFIQIVATCPTRELADQIARALVELRFAACAQVGGPIASTYHWQGAVESAEEFVLVAKTRAELFDRAAAEIARLHPYDTPEIIAVPIVEGSQKYLDWIAAETQGA
ncbi:MAG: divalent-cation tolerance protein CutA [Pirellulales bacterium]|nr:divalent-cation tolerance protein CutA [Pirellulales bacterium]